MTAEGVTSLVIESGKVTQDDLATLKSMTRLTNLEMNLDGDLEKELLRIQNIWKV